MRVLFVQKMAGIAGSETYYLQLLPVLRQHGVEPTFLVVEEPASAARNDVFERELEKAGVTVARMPTGKWGSPALLWRIHRFIASGRFDLVQSNLLHADLWLALVKKLFTPRLKLILLRHGYSDSYQARYGFDPGHVGLDRFALVTRFAAAEADSVVAISNGLGALLTESGLVPRDKLRVIPYGFRFDQAVSELPPGGARHGSPQLVMVGRLVAVKQHALVLRTLPALAERFPGLKLVIVGSGPEEAALRRLAEELGVAERIVWTGFVRNIHDYLRDSDVMVFASRAEGFGAVTLEAWFNRIPVVAFDVAAQNEIITHRRNGLLVPPFDVTALGEALGELLGDEALRRRLGEDGRATFDSDYTLDVMARRTVALYREVAGAGATSAL